MSDGRRKRSAADYAVVGLVIFTLVATILFFGRTGL